MITVVAALEFGVGHDGASALREGFSAPEDGFVWSVGRLSRLRLPMPARPDGVCLEIVLAPFVCAPRLPGQRVLLAVNDTALEERVLRGEHCWRVDVPAACLHGAERFEVTLHQPDAASPASLRLGDDVRPLAFALHRLALLRDDAWDDLPQPRGRLRLVATHIFGCNEPCDAALVEGWGAPEPGHVWALGRHSVLRLPAPDAAGDATVVLDILPLIDPPDVVAQRIAIGVNGRLAQYVSLDDRGLINLEVPAGAAGAAIEISFDNMDAATSRTAWNNHDGRPFAFMLLRAYVLVEAARPAPTLLTGLERLAGWMADGSLQTEARDRAGLAPEDIVLRFESLGNACEFGTLQRKLGQEPAGLLRFSGIMTGYLVHGLMTGFHGLGRPDRMVITARDDDVPGWLVVDQTTSLVFRTPQDWAGLLPDEVGRRVAARLGFLRRKFFEDAVAGERIFIFQRRERTTLTEAQSVLSALARWGDPFLLWTAFEPGQVAGSVERIGPRLLRGFLDQPAGDTEMASDECWLSILANAVALAGVGG